MIKYFILLLVIITTFIACGSVEDTIDDAVKESQSQMIMEISNASKSFDASYQVVMQQLEDTAMRNKVGVFYFHNIKTSKYIDSLQIEMGKLDEKDPKSIDLIQRIFLTEGIGERLFNEVKLSYALSEELAFEDTLKFTMKSIRDQYSDETREQLFTQNSPMGVSMLLYGIESELLKDGVRSLDSYNSSLSSVKRNK